MDLQEANKDTSVKNINITLWKKTFESLHDRKKRGTGSGIKWDFKEKDMIKVNSFNEIKEELEKHFQTLCKLK